VPAVSAPAVAGALAGRGLVSVVMNFLNAERFIKEAIESVCAQSYTRWELLLIDDGSTDGSTAIARNYAARNPNRIRYLEFPGHENRGASAARNLGILEACGEFVAFLDADDVWLPQRLERSIELLRRHPRAEMVYGETEYWFSWAGDEARDSDWVQPHGFSANRVVNAPELLIRHMTHAASLPCTTSITVRRDAALASGAFVNEFRDLYDDQVFLARFCLGHAVYVAHECWDRYRRHDASMCSVAERQHLESRARQVYLEWLRSFLAAQGMRGTRVWDALRYAEQAERFAGRGVRRRVARAVLRAWARARMMARPRQKLAAS
jgi:glycosyltransferase involved in cell wall biosynthesis